MRATAALEGGPGRSLFGNTVRFEYAENTGGFLSMGADLPAGIRTAIFTVGTGLVLLGVLVAALRLRWTGPTLVGLLLMFSGGTSNLVDRVVRGSVVDFMSLGVGGLRTGIFNLADVQLMLGVGIFVLAYRERENDPARAGK